MYDLLPEAIHTWQRVEREASAVLNSYGYEEIRLPLLEKTELFARAIGESTDVVSKEMYSFDDRKGDSLTLRPEGTAGCVRAVLNNGLLGQHQRKVWYFGPMFRYENVQRGRNRQFYQIGAEAYGQVGPDVDAELILLLVRLWRRLQLSNISLEINSLGTPESRAAYRDELVAYLESHRDKLDADSINRLSVNPMRILDSKNPDMHDVIAGAPVMLDHLDEESEAHFAKLRSILDAAGVAYTVNPRLVRGLDYYSRTVFEFITDELGSQGTVCGGGRYDALVAQQGGPDTPAVGFSMGVDRLVELMQVQGVVDAAPTANVYMVLAGEGVRQAGLVLAEQMRDQAPGIRIETNMGGGSFKAQFKRADRSGADLALVIGEDELANQQVTIKFLREDRKQEVLAITQLSEWLNNWFSDKHGNLAAK